MKKILLVVVFVLSLSFFSACGKSKVQEITVHIKQGSDPVEQVNKLQSTLAELFINYRSAALATHALFLIDPTITPISGFETLSQKVIAQRVLVQKNAQELGNLIPKETSFFVSQVYANDEPKLLPSDITFNDKPPLFELHQQTLDDLEKSTKRLDALYLPKDISPTSEVHLVPNKRKTIDMIKAKFPSANILTLVQNAFGGTAKEAKTLIEEYYTTQVQNYNNTEAFYAKAATTAQAFSTLSKVALFIGGSVITAGGSVVAGGALSTTTLGTAFGSSLSLWQGATIAIGGVSTICAVGEDGVALGFADAQTSASFKALSEKLGPITTVLNLIDLKDGLSNPNNLVTIYERSKYGLDKATEFLSIDIKDDKATINAQPLHYPEVSSDDLIKKLPMGYGYRLIVTPTGEQMYAYDTISTASPSSSPSVGSYGGVINIPYVFNRTTYPLEIDAQVVITSTDDVILQFDDNGSVGYVVEGMQLTAKYTIKGKAKGTFSKDGNIVLKGDFSLSTHVELPPEIAKAMPPQYLAQLHSTSAGEVVGTFRWENNSIKGDISMSANGVTQQGTFETKK